MYEIVLWVCCLGATRTFVHCTVFFMYSLENHLASCENTSSNANAMPMVVKRRNTKENTSNGNNNNITTTRPVYGVGVVYYLEKRTGKLCGIMTWGLPFVDDTAAPASSSSLNEDLVDRMKLLVRTNGHAAVARCSQDDDNEDDDEAELCSHHLAEETKHLALLAIRGAVPTSNSNGTFTTTTSSSSNLPIFNADGTTVARPLHMYVPPKHRYGANGSIKVGWRKRNRRSGVDAHYDEDDQLFVAQNEQEDALHNRPASLVRVYPMHPYGASAFGGFLSSFYNNGNTSEEDSEDNDEESEIEEEEEEEEDDHCRPLEEDPLWLRKKDASRGRTKVDIYSDAYKHNLGTTGGYYYDGRRAHKWL